MMGWRRQASFDAVIERTELPMLGLSLVFIGLLVADAAVELSVPAERTVRALEWTIWAAFAAELSALLWTAPSKRGALRRHWLDVVIVVVPFLRPLRVGRALRVVRAGSIFARALRGCRDVVGWRGVPQVALGSAIAVTLLSLLAYVFEHDAEASLLASPGDALWWGLVTSTTVGYGDLFPVTPAGRVIAGLLMIVGVALLSTLTASVAAYFVERDTEADLEDKLDLLSAKLDRLLEQSQDPTAR